MAAVDLEARVCPSGPPCPYVVDGIGSTGWPTGKQGDPAGPAALSAGRLTLGRAVVGAADRGGSQEALVRPTAGVGREGARCSGSVTSASWHRCPQLTDPSWRRRWHSWGVGSDTYYEILGVSPTATPDEIRARYRSLIHRIHPDLDGPAALFRQVQEAYEVLSDPDRRASYDRFLGSQWR